MGRRSNGKLKKNPVNIQWKLNTHENLGENSVAVKSKEQITREIFRQILEKNEKHGPIENYRKANEFIVEDGHFGKPKPTEK